MGVPPRSRFRAMAGVEGVLYHSRNPVCPEEEEGIWEGGGFANGVREGEGEGERERETGTAAANRAMGRGRGMEEGMEEGKSKLTLLGQIRREEGEEKGAGAGDGHVKKGCAVAASQSTSSNSHSGETRQSGPNSRAAPRCHSQKRTSSSHASHSANLHTVQITRGLAFGLWRVTVRSGFPRASLRLSR